MKNTLLIFALFLSISSHGFAQEAGEDAPQTFTGTAPDGSEMKSTIDVRNGTSSSEIYRPNEDGEISTTGKRLDINTNDGTVTTSDCTNLRTSDGNCVRANPETYNYRQQND